SIKFESDRKNNAFNQPKGTIEFWFYATNLSETFYLLFQQTFIYFLPMIFTPDGIWLKCENGAWYINKYVNYTGQYEGTPLGALSLLIPNFIPIEGLPIMEENSWNHITIDFCADNSGYMNLKEDQFRIGINGVFSEGYKMNAVNYTKWWIQISNNTIDYNPCPQLWPESLDSLNLLTFFGDMKDASNRFYLDALGLSWDKKYQIGDNLIDPYAINEGDVFLYETSSKEGISDYVRLEYYWGQINDFGSEDFEEGGWKWTYCWFDDEYIDQTMVYVKDTEDAYAADYSDKKVYASNVDPTLNIYNAFIKKRVNYYRNLNVSMEICGPFWREAVFYIDIIADNESVNKYYLTKERWRGYAKSDLIELKLDISKDWEFIVNYTEDSGRGWYWVYLTFYLPNGTYFTLSRRFFVWNSKCAWRIDPDKWGESACRGSFWWLIRRWWRWLWWKWCGRWREEWEIDPDNWWETDEIEQYISLSGSIFDPSTDDLSLYIDHKLNKFMEINYSNKFFNFSYTNTTYTFDNDQIGSIPKGWHDTLENGPQSNPNSVKVINANDEHNLVVEISDYSSEKFTWMWQNFDNQMSGTVKFWIKTTEVNNIDSEMPIVICQLYTWNTTQMIPAAALCIYNGDWVLYCYDENGAAQIKDLVKANKDQWYYCKIDFEYTYDNYMGLNRGQVRATIDGAHSEVGYAINYFDSSDHYVNHLFFVSSIEDRDYYIYIDNVQYSWPTLIPTNNASYDFKQDIEGSIPEGWNNDFQGLPTISNSVNIIEESNIYNKIVMLSDNLEENISLFWQQFEEQTCGSIEFRIKTTKINAQTSEPIITAFIGSLSPTEEANFLVNLTILRGNWVLVGYNASGEPVNYPITYAAENQWYKIKFDFEHTPDKYEGLKQKKCKVTINDMYSEECYMSVIWQGISSTNMFGVMTSAEDAAYNASIDDVRYSWKFQPYTFEDDAIGALPEYWSDHLENFPTIRNSVKVIKELSKNKNIMLNDTSQEKISIFWQQFEKQTYGSIEFRIKTTKINAQTSEPIITCFLGLLTPAGPIFSAKIAIIEEKWVLIGYNAEGEKTAFELTNANIEQWYKIRVDFEYTAQNYEGLGRGKCRVRINDMYSKECYIYKDWEQIFSLNVFGVMTSAENLNYEIFVDNIIYSWRFPIYSFEENAIGSFPEGWNDDYPMTSIIPNSVQIIEELDGHNKVVMLEDTVREETSCLWQQFAEQSYGTIEFWLRTSKTSAEGLSIVAYLTSYYCSNGEVSVIPSAALAIIKNNLVLIGFYPNGSMDLNVIGTAIYDRWYHCRLDFEFTAGKYKGLNQGKIRATVNNYVCAESYVAGYWCGLNSVNMIGFFTSEEDSGYKSYIDDIGYSWDILYDVGDNFAYKRYEGRYCETFIINKDLTCKINIWKENGKIFATLNFTRNVFVKNYMDNEFPANVSFNVNCTIS
ncbi:MAG: hypothetical protein ACTSQ8_23285, partial [Candidatus Helarchaeota archaeon]